ncbi:hypothetical protein DEDE109153_16360 [Deinococcus deserti]
MSPTILNHRLQELCEADIVEIGEAKGYVLSQGERALLAAMMPRVQWSMQARHTPAAQEQGSQECAAIFLSWRTS